MIGTSFCLCQTHQDSDANIGDVCHSDNFEIDDSAPWCNQLLISVLKMVLIIDVDNKEGHKT